MGGSRRERDLFNYDKDLRVFRISFIKKKGIEHKSEVIYEVIGQRGPASGPAGDPALGGGVLLQQPGAQRPMERARCGAGEVRYARVFTPVRCLPRSRSTIAVAFATVRDSTTRRHIDAGNFSKIDRSLRSRFGRRYSSTIVSAVRFSRNRSPLDVVSPNRDSYLLHGERRGIRDRRREQFVLASIAPSLSHLTNQGSVRDARSFEYWAGTRPWMKFSWTSH